MFNWFKRKKLVLHETTLLQAMFSSFSSRSFIKYEKTIHDQIKLFGFDAVRKTIDDFTAKVEHLYEEDKEDAFDLVKAHNSNHFFNLMDQDTPTNEFLMNYILGLPNNISEKYSFLNSLVYDDYSGWYISDWHMPNELPKYLKSLRVYLHPSVSHRVHLHADELGTMLDRKREWEEFLPQIGTSMINYVDYLANAERGLSMAEEVLSNASLSKAESPKL